MHIYHFAPYEPSALKRLMGRHGVCEDEIDRMLRARLFIDLHTVLKTVDAGECGAILTESAGSVSRLQT
jgi:predicted RecB family nuclease